MQRMEQGRLRIVGIECATAIYEAEIFQTLNQHAILSCTVWIQEKNRQTSSQSWINQEIQFVGNADTDDMEQTPEILFCGVVRGIRFHRLEGRMAAKIEAFSHTVLMDEKIESQSYQTESRTYGELIEKIIAPYEGLYIWNTEDRDQRIGRFLLQYQESDWKFIQRVASNCGCVIIPDISTPGVRFYVGLPRRNTIEKLEAFQYQIRKDFVDAARQLDANTTGGLIKSTELKIRDCASDYSLGDVVSFQDKVWIVAGKESQIKQARWIHSYVLRRPENCCVNRMDNLRMAGVAIEGEVVATNIDSTQLKLKTDGEEELLESWHVQPVFYTGSGNGYSGQPEIGDTQFLLFPTHQEENRYIINGADAGEEKIQGIISKKAEDAKKQEERWKQYESARSENAESSGGGNQIGRNAASVSRSDKEKDMYGISLDKMPPSKDWNSASLNQNMALTENNLSFSSFGLSTAITLYDDIIYFYSAGDINLESPSIKIESNRLEMVGKTGMYLNSKNSAIVMQPDDIHIKSNEVYLENPKTKKRKQDADAISEFLLEYEAYKSSEKKNYASDGSRIFTNEQLENQLYDMYHKARENMTFEQLVQPGMGLSPTAAKKLIELSRENGEVTEAVVKECTGIDSDILFAQIALTFNGARLNKTYAELEQEYNRQQSAEQQKMLMYSQAMAITGWFDRSMSFDFRSDNRFDVMEVQGTPLVSGKAPGLNTSSSYTQQSPIPLQQNPNDKKTYSQENTEQNTDEDGGTGDAVNEFPSNDANTKHMFGNRSGHLPDTEANRKLVSDVANDSNSYLGIDKFGNSVHSRLMDDGSQVWVYSRNGVIQNCGQNAVAEVRIWQDGVGLVLP